MSDVELQSGVSVDESEIFALADALPEYFKTDKDSDNYKLYGAVAEQVYDNKVGIDQLEKNTKVSSATSIGGLQKLGKLVNVKPRQNESIEHYRNRIKITFQNISNEGSINEILDITSFILEVENDAINYIESEESGLIILGIPQSVFNQTSFNVDDFVEILNSNVAAGYTLTSVITGTFTYISPDMESNNEKGYDGLDNDGNKKGHGGTYSTVY